LLHLGGLVRRHVAYLPNIEVSPKKVTVTAGRMLKNAEGCCRISLFVGDINISAGKENEKKRNEI